MSKSPRWKIVLYAALIFIGGLVSGLVLGPVLRHTFLGPPSPAVISHHLLWRLKSRLHLTPDQVTQIKPFVEKAATDFYAIRSDAATQVSNRMEEANSQIAQFLTPQQKAELQKLESKHRAGLSRRLRPASPP
jgi:hypothetical protein